MEKKELLIAVLELCDENDSLRRTILALEAAPIKGNIIKTEAQQEQLLNVKKHVYELGKAKLLDDVTYSWQNTVYAKRQENGEIKLTQFDKWVGEYVKAEKIPYALSKAEVIDFLYDKLSKLYQEEVAKAIKMLEDKEKEAAKATEETE